MRKFLSLLTIVFILTLSGCGNITKPYNYYDDKFEFTVINNTDQFINFSVIEGVTSSTNAKDFYSQYHNYLTDCVGTVFKQQLIAPRGSVSSDGTMPLDRMTYLINDGSYNVTIFVCKDNSYTGKNDVYINKMYFTLSGDRTVTINSNGSIY